ncbi:MAG: WYL domain-containing protein [Muribaculaceae bacterium]|nr:WYL domain-containing protein [Muribaculaceae bacterium]
MAQNLISKYIWIIDTLTKNRRLSKEQLNDLWKRTQFSGGIDLPDRTFYHYRRSIEEIFNIEIKCDRGGQYYIEQSSSMRGKAFTNWLLDSMAVSTALNENQTGAERIEIEDVPSARQFLPLVLEAIKDSVKLCFTYAGFSRSRAETKIMFQPFFLKRYKQRWYMIGLKEKGNSIRTYALDRVKEMQLVREHFEKPGSITLEEMFGNIVGVTTSKAPVRLVKLKTTPIQAKYFRALPLHPSQSEETHDDYSIFTYKLQLNYELAHEILSMGDAVKVLEPKELEVMVVTQLKDALKQYEG